MSSQPKSLGEIMSEIRKEKGWSRREMASRCGVPASTLSKVENGQLTLTYDRICAISEQLEMSISEFFAVNGSVGGSAKPDRITGRRSMGRLEDSISVETPNYETSYLCTEMRQKSMVPLLTKVRTKSLDDFGPLQRHSGEEFVFVLSGCIEVQTEFYDPVVLQASEFIYIDSEMGHAYLTTGGYDESVILCVCAGGGANQLSSLISLHDFDIAKVNANERKFVPAQLKPFVEQEAE